MLPRGGGAITTPVPPLPPPTQLQDGERTGTQAQGRGPRLSICHPPGDETLPTQTTSQSCLTWAATSSPDSPMPVTSALCLPLQLTGHRVSSGGHGFPPATKESLSHSRGNFGRRARCRLGACSWAVGSPTQSAATLSLVLKLCSPELQGPTGGQAMQRGPEVPSWSFKGGDLTAGSRQKRGPPSPGVCTRKPRAGPPGAQPRQLPAPWHGILGVQDAEPLDVGVWHQELQPDAN